MRTSVDILKMNLSLGFSAQDPIHHSYSNFLLHNQPSSSVDCPRKTRILALVRTLPVLQQSSVSFVLHLCQNPAYGFRSFSFYPHSVRCSSLGARSQPRLSLSLCLGRIIKLTFFISSFRSFAHRPIHLDSLVSRSGWREKRVP